MQNVAKMISQFPKLINLTGKKQYRIIPSVYPPINFFEDLVNPEEMEMLWEIESLTNERLLEEAGDIFLVAKEDRVCGPGSSVVMAAFTHIGRPSRFTNGEYGIYYASLSYETAIHETVYHREKFLHATNQAAMEITMRCYRGEILKPLHNVQENRFKELHNHNDYALSQKYAQEIRDTKSWGLYITVLGMRVVNALQRFGHRQFQFRHRFLICVMFGMVEKLLKC